MLEFARHFHLPFPPRITAVDVGQFRGRVEFRRRCSRFVSDQRLAPSHFWSRASPPPQRRPSRHQTPKCAHFLPECQRRKTSDDLRFWAVQEAFQYWWETANVGTNVIGIFNNLSSLISFLFIHRESEFSLPSITRRGGDGRVDRTGNALGIHGNERSATRSQSS